MTELCEKIQDDYDITVIAAQPEGSQKKGIYTKERYRKIKVIRINLPKVIKTSKLSRIKYVVIYFFLALFAVLRLESNIIFTISSPPILGGAIGAIAKYFKRAKHIYNIQDFNPEQAEAITYANNRLLYQIARFIDNMSCKISDCIVLVGHDMEETLRQRFKHKKIPKFVVINNWTDEEEICPLSKEDEKVQGFLDEYNLREKFVVMYSGNLGLYYDLENIIKVTNDLQHQRDIHFVFVGDGAMKKKMQDYVKDNKIPNVSFVPFQPKETIKYSLNAADLHLVVNQKGIKGVSVPSKIYGVMAAGKPILGVLEEGSEARLLIEKSKSGIAVEPNSYREIVQSILKIYNLPKIERERMGMNGRRYLETNLRKSTSIGKYKDLFRDVLNGY